MTTDSKDVLRKLNVKFAPFSSFVNNSFWYKCSDLKLDEDKLDEVTRHIWGYYSCCEKNCAVLIDCTSFNKEYDVCLSRCYCHGYHINKNTIEGFKECDKSELIKQYGERMITSIRNGDAVSNPSILDLKAYTFTYWFAFPALSETFFDLSDEPCKMSNIANCTQTRSLCKSHANLSDEQKGFFCFQLENEEEAKIFTLKEFTSRSDAINSNKTVYFAFLDPSTLDRILGWPARNFLTLLKIYHARLDNHVKVISIRGEYAEWFEQSVVFSLRIPDVASDFSSINSHTFIGWQKNENGRLRPKQVNLSEDMDPTKLSTKSVHLNLKLIKWRLQPNLDLNILKSTRCLLLGAGTLGCSVARLLLAWGIEHITFVDNSKVSYSNPARQSLYTFQDCTQGLHKAIAAANALKLIHPGIKARGEVLRICVPGNRTNDMEHYRRLKSLIVDHDAVFLLTDSRESRWLPTLLCSFYQKIAITIALGYDSYLVMRHGISSENEADKLGCYFCNDVVAPGNSQTDRTLDQQCTVTRPGLSGIASSFGVELFVALLQHNKKGTAVGDSVSCLGRIPHSIRGFIADYEQMLPQTVAFNKCIACSTLVLNEYARDEENFLTRVFVDRKYLEDVTALNVYHVVDDYFDFPCETSDEDE